MTSEEIADKEESIKWIEQFNDFNEQIDIYRTIIITSTIKKKERICELLEIQGYDVYTSAYNDADFDTFLQKNSRIFLTTIAEFYNCTPDTLNIMSNEHNLLVLDNISFNTDNIIKSIKNKERLKDNYYIWETILR